MSHLADTPPVLSDLHEIHAVAAFAVPWTVGVMCLLVPLWASSTTQRQITNALQMWFLVLAVALSMVGIFSGNLRDVQPEGEHVGDMLAHSFHLASVAVTGVLPLLTPLAVLEVSVLWLMIVVSEQAIAEEARPSYESSWDDAGADYHKYDHIERDSKQAKLITWTLGLVLKIFVFVRLVNQLGVDTEGSLQIMAVITFAATLSFRDSIANMWASCMIALTTTLTKGSRIVLGTNDALSATWRDGLKVVVQGRAFVVCEVPADQGVAKSTGSHPGASKPSTNNPNRTVPHKRRRIYIPNSDLLRMGFIVFGHSDH